MHLSSFFVSARSVLCSCVYVCVHQCLSTSRRFQKCFPSLKPAVARLVNRSFCARPHGGLLSQKHRCVLLHVYTQILPWSLYHRANSLHFDIQVPAIDVHVTNRSIEDGCGGVWRPGGRLRLVPLGYLQVISVPSCRTTNVIQCGCLARWFMSTGFPNDVSIQGFPAVRCRFSLSPYFNVKGWR